MQYRIISVVTALILLGSCNTGKIDYDAAGNFEADEVLVSARQTGELLSYDVQEGQHLTAGAVVGQIDVSLQRLQKEQTEASLAALREKTVTAKDQVALVKKQLDVQQSQLDYLHSEQQRTQHLVSADAAPRKQLDDLGAQIDQLQKQMAVNRQQLQLYNSNSATQNRSILSESGPLKKMAAQVEVQVERGQVVNPISGMVLANYALKGEMASAGKPLYKIASTDTLNLRAYITGDQLSGIKTGQQVQVRIDQGAKQYKNYGGTISWISDKSEFTPKTIQTRDERANLVYAIKVRVKNDGYLKIGMYGEVFFNKGKQ